MAIKPLLYGTGLIAGGADFVDARQEFPSVGHVGQIPAYMLASGPHTGEFSVKLVMIFKMVQQAVAQFAIGGCRQMLPAGKVMTDLPKNPGTALRGPSDHDCISPRIL